MVLPGSEVRGSGETGRVTMKHTDGPWRMEGRRIIVGEYLVADIHHHGTPVDDANGNLIAAAPELLAALKDLLAEASGGKKSCGHEFECICPFNAAKEALRKAEGR